jgi:hypothetical protein
MIKITTEPEWVNVQVIELGPLRFKCSFKEIYSILALLALCWYANGIGVLTEQMQVSQTAYLYGGLKEGGDLAGMGFSRYCEPVILYKGSWETFGQPYVGWDCHRAKTKSPLDMFNNTDDNLNYLNISGVK